MLISAHLALDGWLILLVGLLVTSGRPLRLCGHQMRILDDSPPGP